MITAFEVAAVRRAEAATGQPDAVLMARAAAALAAQVADVLRERSGGVYGRRAVVLAGAGSNGGDALLAGALLARRGAAVTAVLVAGWAHEAGLAAVRAAGGRVLALGPPGPAPARAALARAAVVLDGLVGAGGRPGLSGDAAALVAAVPPTAAVVAVDLPSGVDPDTGELPDDGACVHADRTVTFGAAKPALLLPPAVRAAGRVVVADIGLDARALGVPVVAQLAAADVAARWPVPGPEADKYSRGVLGVVAGGDTYTGAAVLCTGAAVRAGAGMVRYLGPPRPTELIRQRWPEVVPGPGRVQAWVAGPGIDPADPAQVPAVSDALDSGLPCLLDAGALPCLAERVRTRGPVGAHVLLTPHAGELATLLSALGSGAGTGPGTGLGHNVQRTAVQARPLEHVRAAVRATGATVLLKGSTTLVVAPDGRVRAQTDGPGWLGTAGAGDVLAGIAGALLAAGLEPLDAGSVATAVHGRAAAAASAGGPVHAEAVSRALPGLLARLLSTGRWA